MTRASMRWIALATLGAALAGCGADTDELQRLDGSAAARGQAQRHAADAARRSSIPRPTPALQAVEPFSNQKLPLHSSKRPSSRIRCWRLS